MSGCVPPCAANVLQETCVHAPPVARGLSSCQSLDDSAGISVPTGSVSPGHNLGEAEPQFGFAAQVLEGAPLFIEVCCGCARLSAHVRQCGFRVLAIDQKSNRHKPLFRVHCLDVSKDRSFRGSFLPTCVRMSM